MHFHHVVIGNPCDRFCNKDWKGSWKKFLQIFLKSPQEAALRETYEIDTLSGNNGKVIFSCSDGGRRFLKIMAFQISTLQLFAFIDSF